MSARILDLASGRSRLARLMCTAAFSWATGRRGPYAPGPKTLAPLTADDLMPLLPERIARLEALGGPRVQVTIDSEFTPRECAWCKPERPQITSVRVWGQPRQGDTGRPLLVVAVCLRCALGTPARPASFGHPRGRAERIGAVRQALIEARPGALIRIEVCE